MNFLFFPYLTLTHLHKITERKRLNGSNDTIRSSSGKEISLLGKLGSPLQVHLDSSLLSLHLGLFIGNLASKNLLLALGLANVFNTDMNTLLKDTSIDRLVDTNSNGRFGHIEDDSSASVIVFVGHTLVNGGVGENVNVISYLDRHLVLREGRKSMLTELFGKHVPSTSAGSKGVRHLDN